MQIQLNRNDVLTLIEAGEIIRDGVTITMQDSRQGAAATLAWDSAWPRLTDGTFTHQRRWREFGREVPRRAIGKEGR